MSHSNASSGVPWQRKDLHDGLYPVDNPDGNSVLDGDDRGLSG